MALFHWVIRVERQNPNWSGPILQPSHHSMQGFDQDDKGPGSERIFLMSSKRYQHFVRLYIYMVTLPQDLPMSFFNGIYSIKCLFLQKHKNDLFFGFRFKVLDTKTFKNTVFFSCFLVYVFKNCKKPPVFSVFVRFRKCQKKGKRDTNFFSTHSLTIPKNLEKTKKNKKNNIPGLLQK